MAMRPAGAADSRPLIESLSATPAVVRGGDTVSWNVRTTPDVVAVSARVNIYTVQLQRAAAGRFGVSFRVPSDVPPFFHGRYTVVVTARTQSGETAQGSFVMDFQ